MKSLLKRFLVENWQRKLVALIVAVTVWIVVDHSIKTTKTFPNVQVRVMNLSENYTIKGMQPNGLLSKTISLTLSGKRNVIKNLSSDQLEVVLNAENQTSEKWPVQITRNNITSTNSDVDLTKALSNVESKPFNILPVLTQTAKIPVFISYPSGDPPFGYEYAGTYPKKTFATVRGTETQLKHLKETGLSVSFDLTKITKKELDEIESKKSKQKELISFAIPRSWKKIRLPFAPYSEIEIDDPDANDLTMSFLRAQLLPLGQSVQVVLFFGNVDHTQINPTNIQLQLNEFVIKKNGLYFLNTPLFAANVSNRFIEVCRNNLCILVYLENDEKNQVALHWTIGFVNRPDLEKKFLKKIMLEELDNHNIVEASQKRLFKYQFYNYMRYIQLFTASQKSLVLDLKLENNEVVIQHKK
ncbi:MAG: hypothetical protein K940chlam8_00926 [Chlamydiae bacterium]|nr:hypothetical protein [Chlamydiota bacterium]